MSVVLLWDAGRCPCCCGCCAGAGAAWAWREAAGATATAATGGPGTTACCCCTGGAAAGGAAAASGAGATCACQHITTEHVGAALRGEWRQPHRFWGVATSDFPTSARTAGLLKEDAVSVAGAGGSGSAVLEESEETLGWPDPACTHGHGGIAAASGLHGVAQPLGVAQTLRLGHACHGPGASPAKRPCSSKCRLLLGEDGPWPIPAPELVCLSVCCVCLSDLESWWSRWPSRVAAARARPYSALQS